MNTRLRNQLLPMAAAVLLSHEASALEEVVVYGTDMSHELKVVAERVAETMSRHATALNDAQKKALEAEMAKLCERKIQIAAANLPIRG